MNFHGNNVFDNLDKKLDRLVETLGELRAELVAIKVDLNYHIHRTNVLEEQVKQVDKDITKLRGFFTIAGWLVAGAATILTILDRLNII